MRRVVRERWHDAGLDDGDVVVLDTLDGGTDGCL